MKVVDHSEHHWILFASGDRLLFDVNCSQGAFSYCFIMELNEVEAARYRIKERDYLSRLADDVQNSAPGMRLSKSEYRTRNIYPEMSDATAAAFARYRDEKFPKA